ncbi:hypothetical protein IG631_18566 [Alternaria alternata]|nr:hypothetical protein IG631_18566 [Alternaria alternata]
MSTPGRLRCQVGRVICWLHANALTQRRVQSEGAPPGSAEPQTRDDFSQPLAFPTEESSPCCKPLSWLSNATPDVVRCLPLASGCSLVQSLGCFFPRRTRCSNPTPYYHI